MIYEVRTAPNVKIVKWPAKWKNGRLGGRTVTRLLFYALEAEWMPRPTRQA